MGMMGIMGVMGMMGLPKAYSPSDYPKQLPKEITPSKGPIMNFEF